MNQHDGYRLHNRVDEPAEQPGKLFIMMVMGAIALSVLLAIATAAEPENEDAHEPHVTTPQSHKTFDPAPLMLSASLVSPEFETWGLSQWAHACGG
jgi:hypothetical protein